MGSYNSVVITSAGQELLTRILGEHGTITFSKFQTSSYQYPAGTDLTALTSLREVKQEATPSGAGALDAVSLYVTVALSNEGVVTDYTANTLGMFASDGTNEVLFGVATGITPDVIPADTGGAPSTFTYRMQLTVSSTSDITITVDPGAYASAADFTEHVNTVVLTNAGVHGIRGVSDNGTYKVQIKDGADWKDAGTSIKKASYDQSPTLYAHSVGDLLYYNEHFYNVTSAISVGDTLTVGTNISVATMSADTPVYVENLLGNKDQSYIFPSSDSVTVTDDPATVTLNVIGNGTLSAVSSDTSIATVSLSGTTLTITGVDSGSATITVTMAESASYLGTTATISVDVSLIPELVIGNTYFFGGYYWTAAEDLGNNSVCLQSQGMTAGTWPAYKLTSDYSGTKSYGSADTAYASNIDGDNIANYDAVTQAWYTKYSAVEKTGASYGSGLFLVSNTMCNQTTSGQQGSGNYWSALKTAATNYSSFGANNHYSWLGNVSDSGGAWIVYSNGNVGGTGDNGQRASYPLAPAFNLDLTKVKLVDDHIMLPTEEMPTLVTWANGTDAQISTMVEAADNGIIDLYADGGWRVGDERSVSLSSIASSGTYDGVTWSVGESQSAQTVTMVLMDRSHYNLTNATAGGKGRNSFVVGLKNCLATMGYINSTNTNTGSWNNCARKAWCDAGVRQAIPSTLRNIFKKFLIATGQSNSTAAGGSNVYFNLYFTFFAEKEIFGSVTYSTTNEGAELTQIEWYKTEANRIKKQGDSGSACYWWERSPYASNATHFCRVTNGGNAAANDATSAWGLSPFGCI